MASLYTGMDLRKFYYVIPSESQADRHGASSRHIKWIKPPVFLLCLVPLGESGVEGLHDDLLGANPVAVITHSTGTWTLVVSLRHAERSRRCGKLLHRNWLIRFRRMFGLFAFFYGVPAFHHLHLARSSSSISRA